MDAANDCMSLHLRTPDGFSLERNRVGSTLLGHACTRELPFSVLSVIDEMPLLHIMFAASATARVTVVGWGCVGVEASLNFESYGVKRGFQFCASCRMPGCPSRHHASSERMRSRC